MRLLLVILLVLVGFEANSLRIKGFYRLRVGTGTSLTDNMIACWPLDEASGTREDDFGAFDLTDNNGVTGTTGPTGLGNASSFAVADDEYLSHADDASLRMGDFSTTFIVWINPTTSGVVLSKDSGVNHGYVLYFNASTDELHWVVYDTMSGNGEIAITLAENTGWHFIVCGYDKPNGRIYMSLDGGAESTDSMANPPTTGTTAFEIGQSHASLSIPNFNGGIAGAALWNRLLTTTEITTLYANGDGSRACEEGGN